MTFEQVMQIIVTGALILGSTWKLSSQIADLSATLKAHMAEDERRFGELNGDLDGIAPRAIRLVKPRR